MFCNWTGGGIGKMEDHRLIPAWDECYNINNKKIDTQHKKLFELAAKVENAVYKFVKRDELKEILTELFNYMKEHFHDEEKFMEEIQYPYLHEHRQMHKNIIYEMSRLIQNIKTTNDLKERLYHMMSNWLYKHILKYDIKIAIWANENKTKILDNEKSIQEQLIMQENLEFIYSCPCKIEHRLNFEDHTSMINENAIIKCKKCQQILVFLKSKEKTYKG